MWYIIIKEDHIAKKWHKSCVWIFIDQVSKNIYENSPHDSFAPCPGLQHFIGGESLQSFCI